MDGESRGKFQLAVALWQGLERCPRVPSGSRVIGRLPVSRSRDRPVGLACWAVGAAAGFHCPTLSEAKLFLQGCKLSVRSQLSSMDPVHNSTILPLFQHATDYSRQCEAARIYHGN
jgi:hypothetical protein